MQERVTVSIRHHRVETSLTQVFKSVKILSLSADVNRTLARFVLPVRINVTFLQQEFNDVWVTPLDRLVQWQFVAAVHFRLRCFKHQIKYAVVIVARRLNQVNQE